MIEFSNFYQLIAKTICLTGWKLCPRRLPPGSAISSTAC